MSSMEALPKVCTKCGVEKPIEGFSLRKIAKDGRNPHCRMCCNAYYKRNAELFNEKSRAYYASNRDEILSQKVDYQKRKAAEIKQSKRERYVANSDDVKKKRNAYYRANRDRIREALAKDYVENREERLAKSREYTCKNRERIRAREAERMQCPKRRLNAAIRSGVWRLLRQGAKARRHTYDLLGYTRERLRLHLEKQFQTGMTWENFGEWEIDHVIPLSAFNYQTPDDIDFKRAWALSNLRPLWKTDNRQKRSKLLKPFQPSLLIAEPV